MLCSALHHLRGRFQRPSPQTNGAGAPKDFNGIHKRVRELRDYSGLEMGRFRSNTWEKDHDRYVWHSDDEYEYDEVCPFDAELAYRRRSQTYSSPASESSLQKRLLKKQRYFGSVELLISFDGNGKIRNAGRFRIEPGDKLSPKQASAPIANFFDTPPPSPIILENPEAETRWYFKYFLGKDHQNFAGVDQNKQPFFLSIVVDENNDGNLMHQRAILWTTKGAKKLCLPYNYPKPFSPKAILKRFPDSSDADASLKEILDPKIQKELLVLEEQEGSVNFKFGVVFGRHKQTSDGEMLSNELGDESFNAFLRLLGEEITLEGWEKYKGGLDNKTNSTGPTSIYTVFQGHEIMFHCSTLLPHSKDNKQQVERKRHIGNDIVNIVFEVDGDPDRPSFNPSMMKSQFTHIFALVTYGEQDGCYRMWVFSEESVPLYGPALPSPPVFGNPYQFREFLLTKLINGEKAAFNSQVFAEKRERTMDMLIKDMYMEYLKDMHGPLSRMDTVLRTKQSKGDQRLIDFIKLGQSLKLEKILSGDAPTNLATTGIYRKQPWEPQALVPNLPWAVAAADSWANSCLVVGPETGGLYLVNVDSGPPGYILDKSLLVRQVSVLESYGILLLRACEKGKDSYLYVFKLDAVRLWLRKNVTMDKVTSKENRVETSKGSHLYGVSQGIQLRLHVAVCVGHKLKLLQWKYAVSCPSWCIADQNLPANFEPVKELNLLEDPIALNIFEAQSLQICVGFKYLFDLISLKPAETTRTLLKTESKVTFASIVDFHDEDQSEVLLSYNNISILYDFSAKKPTSAVRFCWNSSPQSIVYVFPFVMAFTSDTIEVRLAVNGSLLATMFMPHLQLLASKSDVYFYADPTAIESGASRLKCDLEKVLGPGLSVLGGSVISSEPSRKLYKISLQQLLGLGSANVPQPSPRGHLPLAKQRSNPDRGDEADSAFECMAPQQKNTLAPTTASQTNMRRSFKSPSATTRDSPSAATPPGGPLGGKGSHRGRRNESLGSDSGISTRSSMDVEGPLYSVPSSPYAHADPFNDVAL